MDRRDVASATVASLKSAAEGKVTLFRTIVHTGHGMRNDVVEGSGALGPDWCEAQEPGSKSLIRKYETPLPDRVEQYDLSEAERVLGWKPSVGFVDFLRSTLR